jgi:crossover junction endodeoxyribonuclease RusA
VAAQAKAAMGGALPSEGPIRISCKFFFLKPKSAKKSILHKTTKPDIDKLLRAIMDGVTGICFLDDAQVVACDATKDFCWSGGERAEVEVHGARFGEPAPFHVGAPAADRTEDGW